MGQLKSGGISKHLFTSTNCRPLFVEFMLEAELHRSSISHSTEFRDTLDLDESLRLTAAGVLVAEHKPPSQRAR